MLLTFARYKLKVSRSLRNRYTYFAVLIAAMLAPFSAPAQVLQVNIDGIISPVTARIISSSINQASREKSSAIVIKLNTPGGLMDSTRDIVEQILHSPVPVIAWTGPSGARAASAGFFLLESSDIAAMAPGTNTGASHPVLANGAPMDAVMKTKVENDAAALMRTITEHRGRNEQAAEKTVRESASYTDAEALAQHLIEVVAADAASLLRQLDGREITRFDGRKETLHITDATIHPFVPSLRDRVLEMISDPNIALLLLVLGALGIYVEFSSPGLVAPGVAGAILVLLGLTALAMFPIDWLGAALMVIGLVFFVLEAKFVTHGILTTGGAIALAFGAVMLIDTGNPDLRIRWGTALGLAIPFALITSFLFSIAVRARHNKVVTGVEGMLGESGMTVGELKPSGTVLVQGEYWNAESSSPIVAHRPVRVTGVDGLRLRVTPEEASSKKET